MERTTPAGHADLLAGTAVAVTRTLAVAPAELWELIAAMERIGEVSPECIGLEWTGRHHRATPGATFTARNLFRDGVTRRACGVVEEVVPQRRLSWTMVDHDGLMASRWCYDLTRGPTISTTTVHHRSEHGPGTTGLRHAALTEPHPVGRRCGELAANMAATLTKMEVATRRGSQRIEEAS